MKLRQTNTQQDGVIVNTEMNHSVRQMGMGTNPRPVCGLPVSLPMNVARSLLDRGVIPDAVIRFGIRHVIRKRLKEIAVKDERDLAARKLAFLDAMARSVVAPHPEKANAQHYEVPPEFFRKVLGDRMKYSSAYWPEGVTSLTEAEEVALRQTAARAGLQDGQAILDLGCGWGSLSLWSAARFPRSRITAVSNSHSQRAFIETHAAMLGLRNLRVMTRDMNEFEAESGQFDRVVSVEMFEHMLNWQYLFFRVNDWLKRDGRFFLHIFVHREVPYTFDIRDASDWMSEYFFSGGMMPSDDLPLAIKSPLRFVRQWRWDGTHYEKTANAWLNNMDINRERLWPVFHRTYGPADAGRWWARWRIFFMACAELFGYRKGQEWWVGHYLFEKQNLAG